MTPRYGWKLGRYREAVKPAETINNNEILPDLSPTGPPEFVEVRVGVQWKIK